MKHRARKPLSADDKHRQAHPGCIAFSNMMGTLESTTMGNIALARRNRLPGMIGQPITDRSPFETKRASSATSSSKTPRADSTNSSTTSTTTATKPRVRRRRSSGGAKTAQA